MSVFLRPQKSKQWLERRLTKHTLGRRISVLEIIYPAESVASLAAGRSSDACRKNEIDDEKKAAPIHDFVFLIWRCSPRAKSSHDVGQAAVQTPVYFALCVCESNSYTY